jgi:hypothetical protein
MVLTCVLFEVFKKIVIHEHLFQTQLPKIQTGNETENHSKMLYTNAKKTAAVLVKSNKQKGY